MADIQRLKAIVASLSLSSDSLGPQLLSHNGEEFHGAELADWIYRNVHQRLVSTGRPPVLIDELFKAPLAGLTSVWRGWRVTRRLPEDYLELIRSGLTVVAPSNRWREAAGTLEQGSLVVESAFPNLNPGWFTIGGATLLGEIGRKWRIYCNIDESCAVSVAMHLRQVFDRLDIPFLMKIARTMGAYTRSDGLVAEFDQDRLGEVMNHLLSQTSACAIQLQPGSYSSPFARRVGNGITVARSHSDPSVSFGLWASAVFAECILDCIDRLGQIEWEQIVKLLAEREIDVRQLELSP